MFNCKFVYTFDILLTQSSLRNLWVVTWRHCSRKRNTEFKSSVAVLPAAVEQLCWNRLAVIGPVFPRNITISRDAAVARRISSLPFGRGEPGLSGKCCWVSIKRVSSIDLIEIAKLYHRAENMCINSFFLNKFSKYLLPK